MNFVRRLFGRSEPQNPLQQAAESRKRFELEPALSLCDRALQELPDQKGAILQEKAAILGELGRLEEALHCLEKAVDLSPEDDAVRQRRSLGLLWKGVARGYRECDEWIRFSSPEGGFAIRYPVRLQRQAPQKGEIVSFRDQSIDIPVRLAVVVSENDLPESAPIPPAGWQGTRGEKSTFGSCPSWLVEAVHAEERHARLSAWIQRGRGRCLVFTGSAHLALYHGGVRAAFEKLFQSFRPTSDPSPGP